MARLPSELTPYNISDIVAKRTFDKKTGKETFKAYGSDYSEQNGNVIYFGSVPTERIVAFKAFLDSIKLNVMKDVEIHKMGDQNFSIPKERKGNLSFDVSLSVPAHSVNESRNNVAKVAELQRLIIPGEWFRHDHDNLAPTKPVLIGASNRTMTVTPFFVVFFKNIINSGQAFSSNKVINSFTDLFKLGFPCYIEDVKYEPDQEAGYFEYDGYLYPKNLKLNLKLNYESQEFYAEKGVAMEAFQTNGHYVRRDTGLFPFHVKIGEKELPERPPELKSKFDFSRKQMNDIFTGSREKLDSYIFISTSNNPDKEKGEGKEPWNSSKIGACRYVIFKPMIEDFSRSSTTKASIVEESDNQSIYNHVIDNGMTFNSVDYTLKFNVASSSLEEAKKNAGKIQYLLRMFFKKKHDGKRSPPPTRNDISSSDARKKLFFYIPSMIEMPRKPHFGSLPMNHKTMYYNAVPLFLEELDIGINIEEGFLEEGGKIYPKSYSITMKMMNDSANLIRPYYMTGMPEDENYDIYAQTLTPTPPQTKNLIDDANAYLFPYNRKTSKIGS